MRKCLLLPLALLSAPLMAAELKIDVEIPRLQVAEYHPAPTWRCGWSSPTNATSPTSPSGTT